MEHGPRFLGNSFGDTLGDFLRLGERRGEFLGDDQGDLLGDILGGDILRGDPLLGENPGDRDLGETLFDDGDNRRGEIVFERDLD